MAKHNFAFCFLLIDLQDLGQEQIPNFSNFNCWLLCVCVAAVFGGDGWGPKPQWVASYRHRESAYKWFLWVMRENQVFGSVSLEQAWRTSSFHLKWVFMLPPSTRVNALSLMMTLFLCVLLSGFAPSRENTRGCAAKKSNQCPLCWGHRLLNTQGVGCFSAAALAIAIPACQGSL